MYKKISESGYVSHGVKQYVLDTPDDIEKFKKEKTVGSNPGTVAFVISTGQIYMLNNKKQWVEI